MYMIQPRIDQTALSSRMSFARNGGQHIFSVLRRTEGTGSLYDIARVDKWRDAVQKTTSLIIEIQHHSAPNVERAAHVDVRSATEHLANIRRVFNPAISDLANAFGVSRQAIYKWIGNEANPEPEKFARIKILSQAADEFSNANVSRAPAMLKMKAFDGKSLLDLVASGQASMEHIRTLTSEAQAMENAYNRSGLARKTAPVSDDWRSEISIPGLPE
jgi:hypothetical protein